MRRDVVMSLIFAAVMFSFFLIDPSHSVFRQIEEATSLFKSKFGLLPAFLFFSFGAFGGFFAFIWGVICRLLCSKKLLLMGLIFAAIGLSVGLPHLPRMRSTYVGPDAVIPLSLMVYGLFSAFGWLVASIVQYLREKREQNNISCHGQARG